MFGENSAVSNFDEVKRQNYKVYEKTASSNSLKNIFTIEKISWKIGIALIQIKLVAIMENGGGKKCNIL